MAFFSDLSFKEKLIYYDIFYDQCPLIYGVLLPLISALIFIYFYPYPARWIYKYSATQHNKLKKAQIQIEDETPLTQEEANVIRKVCLDQQTALQRQLQELSGVNQELRQQLRQAIEQMPVSERQQQEDAFASDDNPIISNESSSKPLRASLSDETQRDLLQTVGGNDSALDVFLALISLGGSSPIEKLVQILKKNRIDIDYGIDELRKLGLVEYQNIRKWTLTPQGKEIAVNMELTRLYT